MSNLEKYGWNPNWNSLFEADQKEGCQPVRIISETKGMYRIATADGEAAAQVSGRFRFTVTDSEEFPAVGDWVVAEPPLRDGPWRVHSVLPRSSRFARARPEDPNKAQVVAANMDYVWIVMAANDINLRRLERYITAAWESGAIPIVVITKCDLIKDVDELDREIQQVAPGTSTLMISVHKGIGLEQLKTVAPPHTTAALLGSSGAGKSTLVNAILGEDIQNVQSVRGEDLRGRHTTTNRTLFVAPSGILVMDTPGMRELQLWDGEEALSDAFSDVEELSAECRFADCEHRLEPGCAVLRAIETGALTEQRLNSYHKLQRELAYMARKHNHQAKKEHRNKFKKINRENRQRNRV